MNETSKVGFALLGIKTEQFAILESLFAPKKEIELKTEFDFRVDQKNRQIGVYVTFEFVQGKKVFLKIQVSCHFKIEENSWKSFLQGNGAEIVIPKAFLAHLAMVCCGTARGILFAKTESTSFSKYIIPMLNVAEMIKEDAVFDISEI